MVQKGAIWPMVVVVVVVLWVGCRQRLALSIGCNWVGTSWRRAVLSQKYYLNKKQVYVYLVQQVIFADNDCKTAEPCKCRRTPQSKYAIPNTRSNTGKEIGGHVGIGGKIRGRERREARTVTLSLTHSQRLKTMPRFNKLMQNRGMKGVCV